MVTLPCRAESNDQISLQWSTRPDCPGMLRVIAKTAGVIHPTVYVHPDDIREALDVLEGKVPVKQ